MNVPYISALLLSAGLSTRTGLHKATLNWIGKPLIVFQIDCLKSVGFREIIVVLGHSSNELRKILPADPDIKLVNNKHYMQGQTSSIKCGLSHLSQDSDGVMIVNVDQPRSVKTYRTLVGSLSEECSIVTPSYKGISGHPVLFHKSLFNELLTIQETTRGLKKILECHYSV